MKNLKTIAYACLATILVLSFTSCGDDAKKEISKTKQPTEKVAQKTYKLTTNQVEDELLINQGASRADLMTVIELDNTRWLGLLNGFAELHNNLAKIVPEDGWKPVAKELNKLIKI